MENINVLKDYISLYCNPRDIENYFRNISTGLFSIVFLISMIQCLFGYKLTKLWVTISGFFMFGMIGALAASNIKPFDGRGVIIIAVSAIIGAVISFTLYKIGMFILGASSGFLICLLLTNDYNAGIFIGLAMGILVLIFLKPIIIFSTAVPSGLLAGISFIEVIGCGNKKSGLLLGSIFAVCGIIIQFITNKNKKTGIHKNKSRNMSKSKKYGITSFSNIFRNMSENIKKKTNETNGYENSDTLIMLRCRKCGEICPDGSKFCNNCGEPLHSSFHDFSYKDSNSYAKK